MRKLILNVAVSLDGFIEGPDGDYDWCFTDQDYGMTAFFENVDTIIMGRKSYDLITQSGDIAHFITFKIIVVSDTLLSAAFGNVGIIRGKDLKKIITELREQDGGNIWVFGGAHLISTLLTEGVIDEIRLAIHPTILGGGKPLFQNVNEKTDLNLVEVTPHNNGLVIMAYQVLPKINLDDIAGFKD